jgi:DNA-binding transcriptional ArsR family regulator
MPTHQNQPHKLKAKIFYALSDPTRIEILEFLRDGEKCVCQIVPHLGLIQPVVSRHLKILKDAGVVLYRKDGTRRLYTITDPAIYQILDSVTPQLANTLVQKIIEQIPC